MLKYSLQIALLICSLNAFVVFCQKMEDRKDVRVTDSIYTLVEEDASFPGGQTEFLKFMRENLVYPPIYAEIDCVGRIIVKFVVGKNGECRDFEILRGISGCPEFDKSAFQMLKKMPKWIPAKINGNAVDSRYVVPINIDFY
jgi:protein TonB